MRRHTGAQSGAITFDTSEAHVEAEGLLTDRDGATSSVIPALQLSSVASRTVSTPRNGSTVGRSSSKERDGIERENFLGDGYEPRKWTAERSGDVRIGADDRKGDLGGRNADDVLRSIGQYRDRRGPRNAQTEMGRLSGALELTDRLHPAEKRSQIPSNGGHNVGFADYKRSASSRSGETPSAVKCSSGRTARARTSYGNDSSDNNSPSRYDNLDKSRMPKRYRNQAVGNSSPAEERRTCRGPPREAPGDDCRSQPAFLSGYESEEDDVSYGQQRHRYGHRIAGQDTRGNSRRWLHAIGVNDSASVYNMNMCSFIYSAKREVCPM